MSQGVCSHSTVSSQDEFVIFSTSAPLTTFHELRSKNTPFKSLEGVYKGKSERSFLLKVQDLGHLVEAFPNVLYGEESVLHLGPCNARGKRHAHLIFLSNMSEEYIGLFQETQLGPLS